MRAQLGPALLTFFALLLVATSARAGPQPLNLEPAPRRLMRALSPGPLVLGSAEQGSGEGASDALAPVTPSRFGLQLLAGVGATVAADLLAGAALTLGVGLGFGDLPAAASTFVILAALGGIVGTPAAGALAVYLVGTGRPEERVHYLPPFLAGLVTGVATLALGVFTRLNGDLVLLLRWLALPVVEALAMNAFREANPDVPVSFPPAPTPRSPAPSPAYPTPPGVRAEPPQRLPLAADAVPGARRDPNPLRSSGFTLVMPVALARF